MLKLDIVSDLHLDCYKRGTLPYSPTNDYGADVLVLAGDVTTLKGTAEGSEGKQSWDVVRAFLRIASQEYKQIIAISGNHEYYRNSIDTQDEVLSSLYQEFGVEFLQNEALEIEGVKFLGSTLWTKIESPLVSFHLSRTMNDYRLIRKDAGRSAFTPEDSYKLFQKNTLFLEKAITPGSVVITHHAPSSLSIHPDYANDIYTNQAYYSDLSELILDTKPQLWIHGHMHNPFDYGIGDTRVICNPHGYPGERNNFSRKIVEVAKNSS